MLRRSFAAAAAIAPIFPMHAFMQAKSPPKIGVDLFSVRSSSLDAFGFLDYAAGLGAHMVHFSEVRFLGSLEDDHVRKVRSHAEKAGIELEVGMRSICPSSKAFDSKQGTAEQQLERVMRAASLAGSKIVRAFLGTMEDRRGPIPIEGHIENAAKVLRNVKSRAQDLNLKIAIENHAGDMQGRELRQLIEAAGKDFVGAVLDSGNPLWALEDPHVTLEAVAPYVLTSHVRDSAVWRIPEGAAVAWTRLGEGNIGIESYLKRYIELCPGRAISLEIIVTNGRKFPYYDAKFWDGYRNVPAWSFAQFVSLADKGQPRPDRESIPKEQQPARERADLEASMQWLKKFLAAA
ncbi:MAG: sugar phosphate isomerase/epimerase [Bryobacteraceae bacterium]|nr:sugar phosphate isomerase/epimerase [Bryobacteraceae bacterium]